MGSSVAGGHSARATGTLLLADISGYTGFLQGVADAHRDIVVETAEPPAAYALMSSLLDVILTKVTPPFQLAKLEGDAVFGVASDTEMRLRGADLLACLRACHAAFRARLAEANTLWTCTCSACLRVHELDLKFVLHHGDYVIQAIAGREELLGPEVNAVHRLLKNHVREAIGARPYALLTDALLQALGVPSEAMIAITETYPDVPPIAAHILPLA